MGSKARTRRVSIRQPSTERPSESSAARGEEATARVTVLVVDAQLLFADALAQCLARSGRFTVLDQRPVTGHEALQAVSERSPDVVLIDYWLADTDAAALTRELLGRLPETLVIHLSASRGPLQVEASLDSGAVGSLPKSLRVEQVVEALGCAVAGQHPILPASQIAQGERAAAIEEAAAGFRMLTPRELGVLRELARGRAVDQIARELGITYGTARTHITRILSKTAAGSQLEVVARAREQGLVP